MDLSPSPRGWSAASPFYGRNPRRRPFSWRRISSRWSVMASVSFARFMKPERTRLPDTSLGVLEAAFMYANALPQITGWGMASATYRFRETSGRHRLGFPIRPGLCGDRDLNQVREM